MIPRLSVAVTLSLFGWLALAQSFPSKPIAMIVPFAAGGPADVLMRNVALAMGKTMGQAIIVENIAGASGNIGVARALKAAPDGYTILYHNLGMATAPSD